MRPARKSPSTESERNPKGMAGQATTSLLPQTAIPTLKKPPPELSDGLGVITRDGRYRQASGGQRDVSYSALEYTVGAVLTVGITLFFILLWWNRYFAVTNEGWHFSFAQQIVQGSVPYRDFYLFVPPLMQLEMAATIKLFGNYLIGSQIIAILEMLVLALVLYSWMARLVSSCEALVASTFTMILFLVCYTEPLDGLHTPAGFYPVLALAASSFALQRRAPAPGLVFVAGIFAGLSVLAKQTSGIATVLSLVILVPVLGLGLYRRKAAVRLLLMFLLGLGLPLAAVSLWLARNGALYSAISDVFLKGTSSKGSPGEILLRPGEMVWGDFYLRRALLSAGVLIAVLLLPVMRRLPEYEPRSTARKRLWVIGAALFSSMTVGWMISRFSSRHVPALPVHPEDVSKLAAEIGASVLCIHYGWLLMRGHKKAAEIQHLLANGFSLAIAYFVSLSWPVYSTMILPGLAIVLATVLKGWKATKLYPVLIAWCCLVAAYFTWKKCDAPYDWGGWREPNIRSATERSSIPELKGYRFSPATLDFLTRVTRDIQTHSRPDQPIYVYPDMAIFYVLSHRRPDTFAYIHYIDVAPDFIDRKDAQILRKSPPAVVVYLRPTENELRGGESLFRDGHPSGQRDLIAALDAIRPAFHVLDRLPTPRGRNVEVWVQNSTTSGEEGPRSRDLTRAF